MQEPQIFADLYAGNYDSMYAAKDYLAECDVIERAFARFADGRIHTIADFGCGTGSHAIPLARRGYAVVGVDRSDAMLTEARTKADRARRDDAGMAALAFRQGDLRDVSLQSTFDAVLMMFAVLGYQHTNQDVIRTLTNIKRHLRPGGLLVCDIWYGPAVLHDRPGKKSREMPTAHGRIIRMASSEIDVLRHLCTVDIELTVIEHDRVVSRETERHDVRFFFPQEIAALLQL
ncbi:MAG: class I SAM-dependent DNA methyltransferase, partial [Gammaproteobacteria bacterium]